MIEINKIVKSFGDKLVLDELSFTIPGNCIYGLLGPNGSGKTTTINILSNLLDADNGSVIIDGNSHTEQRKKSIGIVPQEIAIYQDLTCKENLNFFARIYGLKGNEKAKKIKDLLDLFNLNKYENTLLCQLSGGWRRRVNIAVALLHSPQVVILDEPTSGLDVEARLELWEIIKSLKNEGVSVLITTHQLHEAQKLCTRIGILKSGKLIAEGTLEELKRLIPAKQIAEIETKESAGLVKRANALGWTLRSYTNQTLLYLPRVYTLDEIVLQLAGLSLQSIGLQEVGLEHIYRELSATW